MGRRQSRANNGRAREARSLETQIDRHLRAAERFAILQGDSDAETLVNIETAIKRGVAELLTLIDGHSAFDVIANSFMQNLVGDPESYEETTHEGAPIVTELVALVAMSSDHAQRPAIEQGWPPMDEVQTLALQILELGRFRQVLGKVNADDTQELSSQLAMREFTIRNAAYPHMMEEFLDDLTSRLDEAERVVEVLGFRPSDGFRIVQQITQNRHDRLSARMHRVGEIQDQAEALARVLPESQDRAVTASDDDQVYENWYAIWGTFWRDIEELGLLDVDELAAQTEISPTVVSRIIAALTIDLSKQNSMDLVESFLGGRNPFRGSPILQESGSGRLMAVHEVDILPALRVAMERVLIGSPAEAEYTEVRAKLVETTALGFLVAMLPGARIFPSFEHFAPTDPAIKEGPEAYTQLVECDGLLLLDDVAIVLEAKAGALSQKAREGNRARLGSDLRRLVSTASQQAARLRDLILTDRQVVLRDRSVMDLSHVKEVYSIVVILEDLNQLATVTDDLVRTGVLRGPLLPWVVNLFDLRIVSEVIDRPAEFLIYLRRRTLPELTRTVLAQDELDYFMYFLSEGLYIEVDPDVEQQEWKHSRVTTAKRRKFRNQSVTILASHTVSLDSWYFYQQGDRHTPAPKPHLNVRDELKSFVDLIADARPPGWLPTAAALLSGDASTRRGVLEMPAILGEMSHRDGLQHTSTMVLGDRRQNRMLIVWLVVPARVSAQMQEELISSHEQYLAAKKHQLDLERAAMMIFDSDGQYLGLRFDNRDVGPDADLDEAIASRGLRVESALTPAQLTMRLRAERSKASPSPSGNKNRKEPR
ncbi:hypothetical protein GCM10017608_14190 [Agromyces luteolus]|uniref:Uncharacterized protein n=1 Tax=Agromyces luteolus TaxID=88373 RepID=A0A7C9LYR9_9MICO|nr:hypothetical protein [Agromyces luteolus]MUN07717.1 hypothetical protein [Agromyces luteolus]GLK27485.1 hypothetical protein GCM10017608_14190 [Agromyces luteolus]